MIRWMTAWVWWATWRLAVSLACLLTIQNVIHQEGYRVEFSTLLVTGACAILGIRIWMPSSKEKSPQNENR
jgi:predicted MFS family arabinose efflux permease